MQASGKATSALTCIGYMQVGSIGLGVRQMTVELGKLYIITDYTAPFCLLRES